MRAASAPARDGLRLQSPLIPAALRRIPNLHVNGKVWYHRPVSAKLERDDRSPGERLLRIHEVAAQTGLTPRSIRYYEEIGLLEPAARSEGAYRLYDADDVERLGAIRALRDDAGFTLAEIAQVLEDERVRERNRERFRTTSDVVEREQILVDALARIDRQVATLEGKIGRLAAMIQEAEARRAHLDDHLRDIRAGREPHHGPESVPAAPPRSAPAARVRPRAVAP